MVKIIIVQDLNKGGIGSGNFDHEGREGLVGGSGEGKQFAENDEFQDFKTAHPEIDFSDMTTIQRYTVSGSNARSRAVQEWRTDQKYKPIPITQEEYDKISERIKSLKTKQVSDLKQLYQQGTRLDMGNVGNSKSTLAYLIAQNEYGQRKMLAYDGKILKGD